MQRISDGIGEHPSLSRLTLAEEAVSDTTALNVARLAATGRLQSLDLARSALAGEGAVTVARSLSSAVGLTRLDISDNSLSVAAARELANALQQSGDSDSGGGAFAVRFLSLARCGLGPVGGALVARALGGNGSVEELDLSDNGLGSVAGVALARSLRVLYRNGKEARFLAPFLVVVLLLFVFFFFFCCCLFPSKALLSPSPPSLLVS